MSGPAWLEFADHLGSIVGAAAGVLSVVLVILHARTASPRRSSVAAPSRWLWVSVVCGLLALVVAVFHFLGGRTFGLVVPMSVAALVLGAVSTAMYLVDRRRPLLADQHPLRALLTAQWEDAATHRYQFFSGHAPALPKIYVEQRAVTPADLTGEAQPAVLTVPQLLDRFDNALVVAEPGMGKSTMVALIQHLQSRWWLDAKRGTRLSRAPFGPVVPVAVPATALVDRRLPDALATAHRQGSRPNVDAVNFTQPPLPGTRWLILIDGVDEVLSGNDRSDVVIRIAGWLHQSDPAQRFLVATRPLLFGELAEVKGRSVVEFALRRFDSTDLETFAERWFAARAEGGNGAAAARRYLRAIAAARLGTVVEVPLLATIAALVFEHDQQRPLPSSRTELYAEFVRHLLAGRPAAVEQRDRIRSEFERYGDPGRQFWAWLDRHLKNLVESLADAQVTNDTLSLVEQARTWVRDHAPPDTLDAVPDWDRHVRAMLTSTSVLVERGSGLAFTHRSLAEFLAAGERARHFDEAAWLADVRAPNRRNLALFVLGRRQYVPADPLVETLLNSQDTDVAIAGEILAEGIDVAGPLRRRVTDALLAQLAAEDPTAPEALRVLIVLCRDDDVVAALRAIVADAAARPWVRLLIADALDEAAVTSNSVQMLVADPSLPGSVRHWVQRTAPERAGSRSTDAEAASAPSHLQAFAYRRALTEGHSEPGYRLAVALELADAGDPSGITALRGCCVDSALRVDLRLQAARALLRVAAAEHLDWVRRLTTDGDRELDSRAAAATALLELDDNDAEPLVRQLLAMDDTLASRLPAMRIALDPATRPGRSGRDRIDEGLFGVAGRNPMDGGVSRSAEATGSGQIITFYSYRGGTGRTMALANVAWILASNGYRVAVLDWDLESPSLHRYYRPFLSDQALRTSPGLIDMLHTFTETWMATNDDLAAVAEASADVSAYALRLGWAFPGNGLIDLIPPGRQDASYSGAVATFEWSAFYERRDGYALLEALRANLRRSYDFVLIDSRTGLGDVAGIATVQFPDTVVNCFTISETSIEGAVDVARSIGQTRPANPVRVFPVPMRVDDGEMAKVEAGRAYARARFDPMLTSSGRADLDRYWAEVEIPYKPFYAYEEILAVFGDRPGMGSSLLAAYERLTSELTGIRLELPPMDDRDRVRWLADFTRRPARSASTSLTISYAAPDRMWAEWIGAELESAGQPSTLFEVRDWTAAMNGADRMVVVLTRDYLETAEAADVGRVGGERPPHGPAPFLLPIRVGAVRPPRAFAAIPSIDLVGMSEGPAREALFAALQPPNPVRRVPGALPRMPTVAPKVWQVPPRNLEFVGRGTILEALYERLAQHGTTVIQGMAGAGKTELAMEYAHRFASAYRLVWWVSAEDPRSIPAQLAQLEAALGPDLTGNVLDHLDRTDHWLVIFDNVDDPETLRRFLPRGPGSVLITSRSAAWRDEVDVLELAGFERAESVKLIARRMPGLAPDDASTIAERLGDHPLALSLAGASLATTAMPVPEFLESLDRMPTLQGASSTLGLTAQRLRAQRPAAYRLLELIACFEQETTPIHVLLSPVVLEELERYEPDLEGSTAALIRDIARLGLVRIDTDAATVSTHQLVRRVIQEMLPDEQRAATRAIVGRLSDEGAPEDRPALSGDFARAVEVARDIWEERLSTGGANDPGTLAAGHDLAVALLLLGEFTEATERDWDTYGRRLRSLGPRHAATLLSEDSYGRDLRELGDYDGSRSQLARTLEIASGAFGTDHPLSLRVARNLALSLRRLGDLEEAHSLVTHARGRWAAIPGRQHPEAAACEAELACICSALGDSDQARRHATAAVAVYRDTYGERHPLTQVVANTLGVVLIGAGDLADAREVLEECVERLRERLDERHPYVLAAGLNYATTLGDSDRARRLDQQAHALLAARYGPRHPLTVAAATNVAGGADDRARLTVDLEPLVIGRATGLWTDGDGRRRG
ncbi:FxSxx-COOH system tetratricopeptide repeat protein [Micromonospora sp. NPDC048935]|uniref:FxSxx-COOH system tetratricopeptide repeat protein n=1 Tax=Micromonospora sp. NPDC048935 TaxID=3364262 RepID=UPI00371ED1D4